MVVSLACVGGLQLYLQAEEDQARAELRIGQLSIQGPALTLSLSLQVCSRV